MADRKTTSKTTKAKAPARKRPARKPSAGARRRANAQRAWKDAFLQALQDTGTVVQACQAAGISRSAAYRARQEDEDFALRWHDVDETFVEILERTAYTRAINGSDRLLEFLLKAKRPAVYRETSLNVHHSGQVERAQPVIHEPDGDAAATAIAKILHDAGALHQPQENTTDA